MLHNLTNERQPQHADATGERLSQDAIRFADDLGPYIHKVAALLRAAINTGAGEEADQAWLTDLAFDQIALCEQRYRELCGIAPKGARQ